MPKNPHNSPARKFTSKAEAKPQGIFCLFSLGPIFEIGDIVVFDHCNANVISYTNDTGLGDKIFLTGSESFQVSEIEVVEIPDVLSDSTCCLLLDETKQFFRRIV
jgi:hypothetical protein